MRIDKNETASVSICNVDNGRLIAHTFDSFDSINDVRQWVSCECRYQWRYGRVRVSVSQESGYFKSFNMNVQRPVQA